MADTSRSPLGELRRYWLMPAAIAAAIITVDQLTKSWVWQNLGPNEGTTLPLLPPWLNLTLVHNTGVAFGMFQGVPHFFTITSILISIGALYFYRFHMPHNRPLVQWCLGMIIGGAIGNVIDRIRMGFVIDFVHVRYFPGIFNVADSTITVGVLLLAGYLILFGDETQQPVRRAPPADDALLGDLLKGDPPQ